MTVGCLTAALWGIKFNEVGASFRRANYATLPILLITLWVFFWLKALRWRMLLQPLRKFHTREVVPAMMIGFMGNNVLPAHLGEFVRVFVLGREFQLSKTAVFSTVVLERVFDVVAILGFLGVSLAFVEGLPEDYQTVSLCLAAGTVLVFIGMAVYIVWTKPFVAFVESVVNRLPLLPEKLKANVATMLEAGADGLGSMRSFKLASGIIVTSIAQWFLMGVMVYVSVLSFGLQLPILSAFVVVGVTAIGVTVPSTPGFFGVIQVCFWISLRLFDVSQADAFAASVYYQMTQYIPITLVGLYFLSRTGLRLGDIEKEATEGEQ